MLHKSVLRTYPASLQKKRNHDTWFLFSTYVDEASSNLIGEITRPQRKKKGGRFRTKQRTKIIIIINNIKTPLRIWNEGKSKKKEEFKVSSFFYFIFFIPGGEGFVIREFIGRATPPACKTLSGFSSFFFESSFQSVSLNFRPHTDFKKTKTCSRAPPPPPIKSHFW